MFAVIEAILALDVRRKRHMPDPIDRLVHRPPIVGPQPHRAPAEEMPLQDFAVQNRVAVEHDVRARLQLLSGVDERFPRCGRFSALLPAHSRSRRDAPHKQTLDGAAARHAPAEQARRKYPRVVDDDKVAWMQTLGQRRDVCMRDIAGLSIEMEQPRAAPPRRFLRDQIGREIEIELADLHVRDRS
jgi:hypothetical protein